MAHRRRGWLCPELHEISDLRKTIGTVISDSFGISIDTAAPFFSGEVYPSSYLSWCHVFTLTEANVYYILGKTEDGILIGLSDFNLNLQESPSSKRSERWRGMEEEASDIIGSQYEKMAG